MFGYLFEGFVVFGVEIELGFWVVKVWEGWSFVGEVVIVENVVDDVVFELIVGILGVFVGEVLVMLIFVIVEFVICGILSVVVGEVFGILIFVIVGFVGGNDMIVWINGLCLILYYMNFIFRNKILIMNDR